jgi:hypothetical protein
MSNTFTAAVDLLPRNIQLVIRANLVLINQSLEHGESNERVESKAVFLRQYRANKGA